MIAKLAYQTSELYSDAAKLMQLGSIRELWPKVSKSKGDMCGKS